MHRVDLGTPVLGTPSPALSLRQMLPRASGVDHAKREAEDSNTFEHSFTLLSPEDSGSNLRIFFEHPPVNPEFQERFKSIYELLF